MTTHITTTNPVRSDLTTTDAAAPTATRPSRAWALAGIGAGLAGIGTMVAGGLVNAVYDEDLVGDPAGRAEKLADQTGAMIGFHVVTVIGALLMVVFAAGLYRRLRTSLGDDSLAPLTAFAGLAGTAVVSILGSGLDTEFIFGIKDDLVEDDNAILYNHWVGTIPWCWVLAGLAGLALYAAARRGAVPRWIGRVGLVLGGLSVVAGIAPVQYTALMTGSLWLLITATGFLVGDKAHREA